MRVGGYKNEKQQSRLNFRTEIHLEKIRVFIRIFEYIYIKMVTNVPTVVGVREDKTKCSINYLRTLGIE